MVAAKTRRGAVLTRFAPFPTIKIDKSGLSTYFIVQELMDGNIHIIRKRDEGGTQCLK
jgi:hypothetical protein